MSMALVTASITPVAAEVGKCANERSIIDLEFTNFADEETVTIDPMCVGDISLVNFNLPLETVAMGKDGLFSITPVGDQKVLLSALSEGSTRLIALSTDGAHVVSVNLTVEREPVVKEPESTVADIQKLTPGAMLFGLSSSELEGPHEFLSAGDTINILFNYQTEEDDLAYFNSETILQQIKIYDILQASAQSDGSQTFLLEVDGDEGAVLERAIRNGTISFVRLAPQMGEELQTNTLNFPVTHDILMRVMGDVNPASVHHIQSTDIMDVSNVSPQMNEISSTQNEDPKQIQILQGSRIISYNCEDRCERVLGNE
jgi:hypothetical protein